MLDPGTGLRLMLAVFAAARKLVDGCVSAEALEALDLTEVRCVGVLPVVCCL